LFTIKNSFPSYPKAIPVGPLGFKTIAGLGTSVSSLSSIKVTFKGSSLSPFNSYFPIIEFIVSGPIFPSITTSPRIFCIFLPKSSKTYKLSISNPKSVLISSLLIPFQLPLNFLYKIFSFITLIRTFLLVSKNASFNLSTVSVKSIPDFSASK